MSCGHFLTAAQHRGTSAFPGDFDGKPGVGSNKREEEGKTLVQRRRKLGLPQLCSGLWRNHNTVINSYTPHKHAGVSWWYNCPCFSRNLIPYLLLLPDTFSAETARGGGGGVVVLVCVKKLEAE